MTPLLSVNLSVDYERRPGVLENVSFRIAPGEIFGLIGQSGSGKSTLALAVPRLIELRGARLRGSIWFNGRDLMSATMGELRRLRGKEIAMVLQSPMTALNPALRIETQLREVWRAHRNQRWGCGKEQARDLLAQMGLPRDDSFFRRYPHELSVGQAQRVVISMAMLHRPRLLIADEPTSALDPLSGAEILRLFRRLNTEFQAAILYVSHDLASVARLCHTVGVLRDGRMVECGPAGEVLRRPLTENAAPPPGGGRQWLSEPQLAV